MSISQLIAPILTHFHAGLLVLDAKHNIIYINSFLLKHTEYSASDAKGKYLFDFFQDLPKAWLTRKLNQVLTEQVLLQSSWQQRQYIVKLPDPLAPNNSQLFMAQNCRFLPITDPVSNAKYVCLLIEDASESYHYDKELQQSNSALAQANRLDILTSVYNRSYWQQQLQHEMQRAERYKLPLSLLLFDLDRFKLLNERFGHSAGDVVLIEVTALINEMLRDMDIVGRFGGEEFGIILPNTAIMAALDVANRICQIVSQHSIIFQQQLLQVTLSVGVTQFSVGMSADDILREADIALLSAKRQGRNCAVPYESALLNNTKEKIAL